jgi:hypothetical protein
MSQIKSVPTRIESNEQVQTVGVRRTRNHSDFFELWQRSSVLRNNFSGIRGTRGEAGFVLRGQHGTRRISSAIDTHHGAPTSSCSLSQARLGSEQLIFSRRLSLDFRKRKHATWAGVPMCAAEQSTPRSSWSRAAAALRTSPCPIALTFPLDLFPPRLNGKLIVTLNVKKSI